MSKPTVPKIAGACLLVSLLILLAWQPIQQRWQRAQLLSQYKAGNLSKARQHSDSLLKSQPNLATEGMVRVILAEIAVQEQDWEAAETEATTAILRLQQARVESPTPDTGWLKRALAVRVLTELAPMVNIAPTDFYRYPWAVANVKPFIQNIQTLGDTRFDRLLSLPDDAYGLSLWQAFVSQEPLYRRLREAKKITLPVAAKPNNQEAVREVVTRWQAIKAQAFVNLETEALQSVLTGDALEGSLQAVQWWIDNPDAYYTSLELHSLRFLRVTYQSGTAAEVVAEVSETRNNSTEGLQKQKYQVEYTLVKMGDTWLIGRVKVRN